MKTENETERARVIESSNKIKVFEIEINRNSERLIKFTAN